MCIGKQPYTEEQRYELMCIQAQINVLKSQTTIDNSKRIKELNDKREQIKKEAYNDIA